MKEIVVITTDGYLTLYKFGVKNRTIEAHSSPPESLFSKEVKDSGDGVIYTTDMRLEQLPLSIEGFYCIRNETCSGSQFT